MDEKQPKPSNTSKENSSIVEDAYAAELSLQQNISQAKELFKEIVGEGKSYKKPSKFKYGILFLMAGIVDAVDFFEFTGIGWFIAKAISITFTIIIFLIFITTGGTQRRASAYRSRLEEFIKNTERNVAHATRMAMRLGKIAKYVPKLGRYMKFFLASLANLIPILDLFPWMVIGVWLSYLDEKKTLQNAHEAANSLEEITNEG